MTRLNEGAPGRGKVRPVLVPWPEKGSGGNMGYCIEVISSILVVFVLGIVIFDQVYQCLSQFFSFWINFDSFCLNFYQLGCKVSATWGNLGATWLYPLGNSGAS